MSITIKRQPIQRAWTIPYTNITGLTEFDNTLDIRIEVFAHKRTQLFLGHYDPEKIKMDMNELVGMSVAEGVKLLRSRKDKYIKLEKLLMKGAEA